jgi:hypothetical protein
MWIRRGEAVVCDSMEFAGTFDVCLHNGVLYHMMAPLPSLQKVASLTSDVAMIETLVRRTAGLRTATAWRAHGLPPAVFGRLRDAWAVRLRATGRAID